MGIEQEQIAALFKRLRFVEPQAFRDGLEAPDERGVCVIYSPRLKVLHVGATPHGRRGIHQRLTNHLHGQSSFAINSEYLKQHGGPTLRQRCEYLRAWCKYAWLVVEDKRLRALLEAYAIGHLYPHHIGLGQIADDQGVA